MDMSLPPSLFDEPPARAARQPAPATKEDTALVAARALVAAAGKEPLSGVHDALKHVPEELRQLVLNVGSRLFESRLLASGLAAERARPGRAGEPSSTPADPSLTPHMLAHSARLEVLSAVGYLGGAPWHLADSTLVKRIAADLESAEDLDGVQKHFNSIKCMTLYVAAGDKDDRESYLKAVKGLIKRHKVRDVVLDAELVEWFPEAEFLAACADIGVKPVHVGIADRSVAAKHSMMRPDLHVLRTPALFVDTDGTQLSTTPDGAVVRPVPVVAETQAEVPRAAPAAASPAQTQRAEGTAPTSAIQARIRQMREQQQAARKPKP